MPSERWSEIGSFGAGVFATWDARLSFTDRGDAIIVLPDIADGVTLTRDSGTNRFTPSRIGVITDAMIIGTADQGPADVANFQITLVGGSVDTYQLFLGADQVRYGRLVSRTSADGTSSATLVYSRAASQAAPGNPLVGMWLPSSVTDERGQQMTVTERTEAGQAVVWKTTTPAVGTTTYAYANRTSPLGVAYTALTSVAYPDGSSGTIASAFNGATQTWTLTLDDAALDGDRHVVANFSARAGSMARPFLMQVSASGEMLFDRLGRYTDGMHFDDYYVAEGVLRRYRLSAGGMIEVSTAQGPWNAANPLALDWSSVDDSVVSDAGGGRRIDASKMQPVVYTRDATGRVTSITDGSGTRFWTYGTNGLVETHTNLRGAVTKYDYDVAGNVLTRTDDLYGTPSIWSWTYVGHVVQTQTDPLGHVTTYGYDAAGRMTSLTQPPDQVGGAAPVQSWTFDAAGRLATSADAMVRTVTYAYDAAGRLSTRTYGDATTEQVTYGTGYFSDMVVQSKDRNGNVTVNTYDARGRKISSILAAGAVGEMVETWAYIPKTDLVSSSTRNGETTSYVYDFHNRRIAQVTYVGLNKTRATLFGYDDFNRRISETDPDGRVTYFVYDVLDRVVRTVREAVPGAVTDPANVATLVRVLSDNAGYVIDETEYDSEGQVLARVDGRGNRSAFGYDALGRMTSRTEGANSAIAATTTYVYDAAGNQTEVRPPVTGSTGAAMVTITTYTNRNLPATRTEAVGLPEQGVTAFTYFADGKVATTTDANLKTTSNAYSLCCGRLSQIQDPLGFLTKYTYDGVGNVLTVTDANNNVTTTTYDAANRPLKRIDALGKIWTYTYDENLTDAVGIDAPTTYGPLLTGLGFGRDVVTGYGADGSAVAVKDPNGNETVTVYDGARRVVRTIDGARQKTSVAYDIPVTDTVTLEGGGTASVALMAMRATDAAGAVTEQWSDGLGRVRVSVDALGKRLRASFDASGNRLAFIDADGVGHTCTFDARNRQSTCSNAGSGAVSMVYDGEGRVTSRTDARGIPETSFYDGRGRRLSTTDRINGTTLFTYDPVGNLKTITDAQGGVTTYLYDARNLLTSETFPGTTGGTRVYTYDPGRRLSTRKDQTLAITTYLYDKANHLTTRKYPDAKNDTFTYDAAGRLTKAVSARYGSTVDRTYDKANRVLTEKLTLGTDTWTVTGAYDTVGRLTKLTLPDATVQDRAYSLRGELTSAKLASASIATRTYTDGGRLSETTQGNTRKETRAYRSADGLVESITTPGVSSFSYTYDTLLRKTAEIDLITPSNTQRFTYDDASRLTAWDRITGTAGVVETAQSWNLSLVGDWQSTVRDGVTETRTHTPVHEISTIDGVTLTNDVKGNLTRDAQGQTFAWDVENRLASAAALVQQAGDTSASYVYDALGRRVRKLVGQIETTFVSWGAQEVYQLQRNPTAIAADQPPTTATNGSAVPVTSGTTYPAGALLADASAVRVSFRPSSVPAPTGWLADTGLIYGVRTGGQSYGWVGAAQNQTINRDWLGWTLYDTYNQLWTTWKTVGSTPATWELAVANGTYPVSIVCGDAHAIQQRNDLLLEGVTLLDPNPWNGVAANPTTGQLGNFVTLSGMATVTDGKLTLTAASTAKAPKICFIEVGAVGTSFDANYAARANAAIAQVKARTATGRPDAVKPVITANVYGSYVDELLGYRVQKSVGTYATKTSYWVNSNHLYSVAAVTNTVGAVVERYSYNAYGVPTIKNSANATIAKSAVGQDRGFTSYRQDWEAGLLYARARMFLPKMGRFISRDPWMRGIYSKSSVERRIPRALDSYPDGLNTYFAYFAPNSKDPSGMDNWHCCPKGEMMIGDDFGRTCCSGELLPVYLLIDKTKSNLDWGHTWLSIGSGPGSTSAGFYPAVSAPYSIVSGSVITPDTEHIADHYITFLACPLTVANLLSYIYKEQKTPPNYSYNGEGTSENCASWACEALHIAGAPYPQSSWSIFGGLDGASPNGLATGALAGNPIP